MDKSRHSQHITRYFRYQILVVIIRFLGCTMEIGSKIKHLREFNKMSQEEMAAKMHMSTNSYGRIERGETQADLNRLEQIANIFNIDVAELISKSESDLILLITAGNGSPNYYGNPADALTVENEKLKLMLSAKEEALAHKNEMLIQKDKEIALLRKLLGE